MDRDGAVPLLKASRKPFPFVEIAFADSAYGAQMVKDATCIAIEVVRKIANRRDAHKALGAVNVSFEPDSDLRSARSSGQDESAVKTDPGNANAGSCR
ncbi:hypothetical protein [Martelella soudanensis]|uniref:hypothetical protein n=1 Tax=unclassified Martelella TaxID=2629616 RepID=UPI0015DD70FD|nr:MULTISPECIES: hypothetical protein [unclassified Martelella]